MKKKLGVLVVTFTFLMGGLGFAAGAGSQTGAADSPGTTESMPGTTQPSPGYGATDSQSPQMTHESPAVGMHMSHRASEFIGTQVRTPQGEDLGNVDDIVFSDDGQVQYVILSRGGLLGIGATLIPVPFDSAEFTFEQDNLIAHNLDAQTLEGAPTLSDGEWGRLTDPTFERDVRGYYEQGAMRDPSLAPGAAPSPGIESPGTTDPGRSPGMDSPGTTSPGQSPGASGSPDVTSPGGTQSR